MLNSKTLGLLAAGAIVATVAAGLPARAQMMVPVPPGGLMVERYSDAPKADPGDDPANWSARRNVVDSDRYERLLQTNPSFRAQRIQKECGGFTDAAAFQECVSTFE